MDVASHTSEAALQTLVMAVSAGTLLMTIAQRIGVPAIVLLLAGGIILGPQVFGLIQPDSLGSMLSPLVSLAVGLILFEAGLTLDFSGYKTASTVIQRLLTIGTLITWFGISLVIFLVKQTDLPTAVLAASLVIVTGPTVVVPLLKRIRVIPKLHHILQWEGVLIDPIGVFAAVLCFEFITRGDGMSVAMDLMVRIFTGIAIGMAGGGLTYLVLKKRLAPDHLVGIVTLGCAALTFGVSEHIIAESGLLSSIVAGLVTALLRPVDIKRVIRFKAEIADLLIAVLFMVLSARLEIDQFLQFGWRGWLSVLLVMVVVRPVNILVCTYNQGLTWQEKTFLSWLAPRGIVAASMASLFRLMLEGDSTISDPAFIETFTYSVIFVTIVVEGLLANQVAKILKLKRPEPNGWLIVGAHLFSQKLAHLFHSTGLPVAIVDSNPRAIRALGYNSGYTAYQLDARDPSILEEEHLMNMGNIIALTDNEDLNLVICGKLGEVVGRDNVYAWTSTTNWDEAETAFAHVIWTDLPKPSVVSYELAHHEAHIFTRSANAEKGVDARALSAIGENQITIIDEAEGESDDKSNLEQIVIARGNNYLQRCISPDLCFDLDGTNYEEIIKLALIDIGIQYPRIPVEDLTRDIINRERELSMVIGHGFAVPHAYTKAVSARICCIVRCNDTVTTKGVLEPEQVNVVFLVISPPGDPKGHLAVMAEIARLINDPDLRKKIIEAPNSRMIYELIQAAY